MAGEVLFRRDGDGIVNQAFDLTRTFLIRSEDTGSAFSQWVEDVPVGIGPPMHIHHKEQELFRILPGEFRFWCAGETLESRTGDTVLIPSGAPHTLKNIGQDTGRLLITMTPGGLERFFDEVQDQRLHPSTDMPQIAALAAGYNLEFVGPSPD